MGPRAACAFHLGQAFCIQQAETVCGMKHPSPTHRVFRLYSAPSDSWLNASTRRAFWLLPRPSAATVPHVAGGNLMEECPNNRVTTIRGVVLPPESSFLPLLTAMHRWINRYVFFDAFLTVSCSNLQRTPFILRPGIRSCQYALHTLYYRNHRVTATHLLINPVAFRPLLRQLATHVVHASCCRNQ